MTGLVVRRLLQVIVVVIGVTMIAFGTMFLTGDPTYLLLGDIRGMTPEQIAAFRHQMGFDRPWIVQYLDYMGGVLRGDLGFSLHHTQPCARLIAERMPATIRLTVAALVWAVALSVPIGVISAVYRGSWVDQGAMLIALMGQATPVFWLGIMFILLFGVTLRWLPISGAATWRHLVMPALALGTFSMARNARVVRSSMLEVLSADFVRTARAKGLSERVVVFRHALRNALIPVVTLIGMELGFLLGGAVITETIFAWPGVGRLAVQAIYNKDLPLVQAIVIVMAVIFVLLNLVVDLIYTALDPRVRVR